MTQPTLNPAAAITALQGERDKLAKLYETTVRCYTGAISRYEAAEAEVARLKAELAEAHRVIEPLDEATEILVNLTASIRKHGNYGPKATVTFLEQVGQCLWEARSVLAKEPA